MFQSLIEIQRDIYLAFAAYIKAFAANGDWRAFASFLPMGVVFGAVHAMTPGHSKAVLATYVTGSSSGMVRALSISMALSFTHVTMAVLIAVLSLPLVSVVLGSVGRAPVLEDLSRGLLGLIGGWMVWRALRSGPHVHGAQEGAAVGMMAGLIPCPLTLFVMTFAISRGVPEAGVAFAVAMMGGVAVTLSGVAILAVFFRAQLVRLVVSRPKMLEAITRSMEVLAGLVFIAIALRELLGS